MKNNLHALFEAGMPVHIIGKANGSDKLYNEHSDYLRFREKTELYIKPVCDILAGVEIPNHFHKIVIPKFPADINWSAYKPTGEMPDRHLLRYPAGYHHFIMEQFRRLLDSHSKYINAKYERQGSLFIRRLKRLQVTDNEHLIRLILYIHLNPEKHGLKRNFKSWPYSTYHEYIAGKEYLMNHKIMRELMGDTDTYQSAHAAYREKYQHIRLIKLHE